MPRRRGRHAAIGVARKVPVALDGQSVPTQQRRGVLTQVSRLASRSLTAANVTHPSERGALIFEQFLCGDLTQTPSAEQHTKPARNAGETPRDWLARVTAPAMCRTCHQVIDPLGVAFEHYGYSGAWRDTDGGLALDARGTVSKWMETAYGRPVVAADACSQGELEQGFTSSGGNIRDLLLGLTQTEAFLYRPAP